MSILTRIRKLLKVSVLLYFFTTGHKFVHCMYNISPDQCTMDTLQLVQIVFRHGNRTKAKNEGYAKDPYNREVHWLPLGFDQLTKEGKITAHSLGIFLRERYDVFLGKAYYHKDITVWTSNILRTKESALLVCAGLYSPDIQNKWGESSSAQQLGLIWQPIPYNVMPQDDIWLETHVTCPPYEKEYENVLKTSMAEVNNRNKGFYDILSKKTGENITTVKQAAKIYNTLKVEKENAKPLPTWVTDDIFKRLEEFRLLGYQDRTYTDFMKKIKGGPMLDLLYTNIMNKTANELVPDSKIILYSAHDSTIVNILHTLSVLQDHIDPEYGAALIIELHRVNNLYYIKILYLSSGLEKKAYDLTLKDWNNNSPIPLEIFCQIVDKYRITHSEWYKECNITKCLSPI